jgi:hypothetical protein
MFITTPGDNARSIIKISIALRVTEREREREKEINEKGTKNTTCGMPSRAGGTSARQ